MGVTVEASIIKHLRTDSNVTQYVNTFNGSPAIFSDIAPQEAERVYLVLDVQTIPSDNLAVDNFLIDIDIYGGKSDTVNIRALTMAVEFAMDREILNCDLYKTIRLYRETKGFVDNRDIKIVHYNMQISGRGSRYAWMQQIVR
jgi:hypothetical protein|tara:strand:+ start:6145 stop:6573 length:429 start_codon:yes stop_codon:yes gene_type:complete